uniref:dihydropyrimidinase n=1 Tax=Ndongobacter massiliensis TaxID=1871025 RepID=UPI000931B539|nr:dihydropyrimidinase [Ndongobacter massiliensis]
MSILVKNTRLVTSEGIQNCDLFIEGEKIRSMGKNLSVQADRVLDVAGKTVLPGGVDVHTHMSLDLGTYVAIDDFYSGTVAAAHGGTTSIVDHIAFGPRDSLVGEMIQKYHGMADGNAVIDYSFHGAIQQASDAVLAEMGTLAAQGIVSTKIYTTYGGKLDDASMLRVLKRAKETGTVVCVHCENDGLIAELRKEAEEKGNLDPIYHAKTRPAEAEAEAINRLTYLSQVAGFPKLYIVHTSSAAGLREIENARARGVKNLYCETCTQYLVLTEEKYTQGGNAKGCKYICAPPLRKKEDVEALWDGIKRSVVDVIATDHCPFYYKEHKLPCKDNFLIAPGGIPGVEERMEIILTEGRRRGIAWERLVDLLATNPSRIFGLGHVKGRLEPGMDADLVVVAEEGYTIKQDNRHSKCDYTTYEGFRSDYKVETVLSRGRVVLDKDGFYGKPGDGHFIKRKF